MEAMSFSPASLTIPVHTTITWVNNSGVTHTATSYTGKFDTGNILNGGQGSFTFDTAGTYQYHCIYHPPMIATITVQ